MKKNILLVYGGGGTEHEVSIVSSKYVASQIDSQLYNVFPILIDKNGHWFLEDKKIEVSVNFNKELRDLNNNLIAKLDMAIPCLHGYPGETGELIGFFEMIKLPFLGCESESSKICFNKITTKLWLDQLKVPNTPYIFIANTSDGELKKAKQFFNEYKKVFVKASNQGSSVGCFQVNSENDLIQSIHEAFKFSDFVLIEKMIKGRELEISAYELDGQLQLSNPGEIICVSNFYTYEEKYSENSKTKTETIAKDLKPEIITQMKSMAHTAFKGLKLRHLSRIDFFLEGDQVYLNEINTFPGHTPISMFPMMMEANGHKYRDFLNKILSLL